MSRDERHPAGTGTSPDTAVTMPAATRNAAAADAAADEARDYVTAVTISEAVESGGAGDSASPPEDGGVPAPTEVTLPLDELHDTARTVLMEPPATGSGAAFGGLRPGDRVERYVVVKQLGRGGMGSVYLVRHETLGVFRALKVLSGVLYQQGREFTKRFIQEAKIASSISNPNIVNVIDVGEDPERSFCYIIMEYVDGGTVRDVLKRIPHLSELHAVVIAEAVAAALDAASEQRIVHRDIKPDNIMLTRRGEVKLADLGIAKNTDENVQLTKSHVMMGTPAYLAPEQAQDAHSVDVRADIYSLGATLFEMLTGRIPYPGKSTYDILRKMVSDPIPDPREIVDTISAPTARLVMRMLAKQAKLRPASPAELLKEIHRLNFLTAELDPQKCIRELLEQAGEGSYSADPPTSATGNPVSGWLVRHLLLRAETMLRKVSLFASMLEIMQRNIVLSYVTLALLTLLLIAAPSALWLVGRARASGGGVPAGTDTAAVAAMPRETPAATSAVLTDAAPAIEKPHREAPAAAPAAASAAEKPAPELPAPSARKAPRPAAAMPVPATAPAKPTPARASAVKKIGFFAEVSPAGAEVVLRDEAGRVVERRIAPAARRMEFRLPAGQYKLTASAPGCQTAEREFPLSGNRTISVLKIDLRREAARCRIEFYGFPKLLAYLRKQGVEMSVDGGAWRKVRDFPVELELPRTAHTVSFRAKGIRPVSQDLSLAPDQTESTIEIYPQEKPAELEIVSEVGNKVRINLFGIWEELRPRIAVPPFRAVSLKWKAEDGVEQTLEIPELPPESLRRIVLKTNRIPPAGEAELAEGRALLDSGDHAAAAEKLKTAAEKGNPEAMYLLGRMAEQGKGRWFASDKDALAEYRKAAGPPWEYAKAQFKMGDFCENGRGGLSPDPAAAFAWYRKAAARKDPDALFRLAAACRDGEGGEAIDFPKMFGLFSAAAEQGHPDAQYQVGYCYENGVGVPVNVEKAKFWYAKAAERGHGGARTRGRALEGIQ